MRLPAAASRALALALLVALGVVVHLAVTSPLWQSYRTIRDAVVEHEIQIARLLGIAADADRLSVQRDRLRARDDLHRYLLAESSPTLAAAALRKRVKSIVEPTGGQLTSTQVLRSQTEHGYPRVDIDVRLALDTPTLQQVLYQLESRPPLLLINDLTVIARDGRSMRRLPDRPIDLDVRFRVSGWMIAPPGDP